jgi:hypothetical protein
VKPSWATTKLTLLDGAAACGNTSREPAIRVAISPRSPASPRQKRRAASRKRSFHSRTPRPKAAELIAAGTDVPGLGDQLRLGQHRIGGEGFEEWRLRVEALRAAAERRREIEAEAVEAAVDHPAPERADRHVDDQRAVEREAIAGAHIVDVARIAGIEPETRRRCRGRGTRASARIRRSRRCG